MLRKALLSTTKTHDGKRVRVGDYVKPRPLTMATFSVSRAEKIWRDEEGGVWIRGERGWWTMPAEKLMKHCFSSPSSPLA